MISIDKTIVYRLAADYLAMAEPAQRPKLEPAFDVLYETLRKRLPPDEPTATRREQGLPFDTAAFAAGSLITCAIWTAARLVQAASQVVADRRKRHLERLEPLLAEETSQPEMVYEMVVRLLQVLDNLRDRGQDLAPKGSLAGPMEDDARALARGLIPRPDLELQVRRERLKGQTVLAYQLKAADSELDLNYRQFGSVRLQRDPFHYFSKLFSQIEGLPCSSARERLTARLRLEDLGAQLSNELLPPGLRERLWSLQDQVSTVLVLSDEPWVPWELLRLQNPNRHAEGRYLGEIFAMTRWLWERREVAHLPLRHLALVVPRDSGLQSAFLERDFVQSLQGKDKDRRVVPIPATYLGVRDALASGLFDGLHFAGHGVVPGDDPNWWNLRLENGEILTPAVLQGPGRNLGQARPLIFLNACHTGRSGLSLTGIGGLAHQFLEAGAGAVIGSTWALADETAAAFAQALYSSFLSRVSIGEAGRLARLKIKDQFPGDPAWLAYTIFAHPLAACVPKEENGTPHSRQ